MTWEKTGTGPSNTWVVGFWRREGERTKYSEVQYTDDFGWMNRDRHAVPPPDGWTPLPPKA